MKKILIIVIVLNYSFAFTQTEKDILEKDIKKYIQAINDSDYEAQIKFYPEFILDSISKKELLKEIKNFHSENDQSKIIMDTGFKIDTIMIIDSRKYARICMSQNIIMDFIEFKGGDGMDYAVSVAYKVLILEYGKDNVTYNNDEWKFYVKSNNPIYAIKTEDNWTFIHLNEETDKYIPWKIKQSD